MLPGSQCENENAAILSKSVTNWKKVCQFLKESSERNVPTGLETKTMIDDMADEALLHPATDHPGVPLQSPSKGQVHNHEKDLKSIGQAERQHV